MTSPGAADAAASTRLTLADLVALRHDDAHERLGEWEGRGAWHGPFRGRRRGQGLEFDDLRPYAIGDDIRHVDWRTSARRDAIHTRLYREEKDHVLTIAVDLRAPMFTGSQRLRAVTAGQLAARLLWRASKSGCRSGVVVLDDSGCTPSRPGNGERGALDGCRLIAETFDRAWRAARSDARTACNHGEDPLVTSPTLDTLLTRLLDGGRCQGVSIVVSGLDALGDDFASALSRHTLARPLAMIHLADPLERHGLPSGRYRYIGEHGVTTVRLSSAICRTLTDRLSASHHQIAALFERARVPLLHAEDGISTLLRQLRGAGFLA